MGRHRDEILELSCDSWKAGPITKVMAPNMARNESVLESWGPGYLITPENKELDLDRLRFRAILPVSTLHLQDDGQLPSKSSSLAANSQRTYAFQGPLTGLSPCSHVVGLGADELAP
ncbi:uncharacterized protein BO88DRAFT_456058 [Aspergillus vadensis CBS 113365]|uniref:Uncharacterized protein n=1 Tax=Aspergillus vadensis (strain CBS 113365 / IMI 142717 / IBT 24658) TaxID=1448311 RepID=A0A319BLW1_ASPVC|nr:hypothetical protein BO88DRAFT_456058 [Aspergillus vadensis CBS 113365]PYH66653.1 hypothetical protein BO88DRAFT_456058 [Aspergillus vadensis CBS 113365]